MWDPTVRRTAARALRKLDSVDAREHIWTMTEDLEPLVRNGAVDSLVLAGTFTR